MKNFRCLIALLLATLSPVMAQQSRDDIALPTDNDALFHGGGADFYQYITRDFQGVKSTPWEGGQYGFVRDPVQTSDGLVYTRFHEGIDIKPVRRGAAGEPLDEVRAIADGRVVHVNNVPDIRTTDATSWSSIIGTARATTAFMHTSRQPRWNRGWR
ncbi:MAG: hypothetical protein ACR2NX_12870 [Chthoniobacterales bacterium]